MPWTPRPHTSWSQHALSPTRGRIAFGCKDSATPKGGTALRRSASRSDRVQEYTAMQEKMHSFWLHLHLDAWPLAALSCTCI